MAELATLHKWDDTFWFVSDDGDTFYEVAPAPRTDADLEHLRPLGMIDERTMKIGVARRWLEYICTDPAAPGAVEFSTVE